MQGTWEQMWWFPAGGRRGCKRGDKRAGCRCCDRCGRVLHQRRDPLCEKFRKDPAVWTEYGSTQEICQSQITRKDLTVYGSYIGTYTWHNTIQMLANIPMKLEDMITHRLTLEEFGVGFEAMRDGSALEVVMYPNGRP